jgi:adenylate cyclase
MGMGLILIVVRFQMPELAARQMRMLLDIALPRQVAQHFIKHPERYDDTVRMPATIIFTDIRGFTHMVEHLGGNLAELKLHLELVMDKVVEIHLRHDLIVDKFIGDAVMSFRGGPLVAGDPPEHAYRVVRAALESIRAVRDLGDPYFNGMKIGGASTGDCLIGAFGTSRRLSYTALGDAVNLAARLEPASGKTGTRNLFCETTYGLTKDRPDIAWRRFGRLRVEGKDKSVGVYEAFDAEEARADPWLGRFEEALLAFEAGRLELAKKLFEETQRVRPGGDAAAAFYLKHCEELLRSGLPEGWEPVVRTTK